VAKEVPTPIRLWMQRGEGGRMLIGVWTGFGLLTLVGTFAGAHLPDLMQLLVMFGPAAGYGLYRAQYTQRVLAAGYTLEDIRLALRERAQQQREELAFESAAEPPLVARVIRTLTFVAFGVAAGSGLLLAVLPWRVDWLNLGGIVTGLWTAFGFGSLATVAGGLIGHAVPGRRIAPKDPLKSLRVRVWGGRLGDWFTRIASLGMDRKALPATSAHRPTEIAIGIAASALFEALPKETRKGLPDLPDVLRRLEADAQAMRRSVDELNAALASLGQDGPGARSVTLQQGDEGAKASVAVQRNKLRDDLTATRDAAARRLATAVAALENLRLDLLRLKAGAGTVDELSANLTAARRLAGEIDAVVAGRIEAEELLRRDG
jgi:serine/threonine-protein kinase